MISRTSGKKGRRDIGTNKNQWKTFEIKGIHEYELCAASLALSAFELSLNLLPLYRIPLPTNP